MQDTLDKLPPEAWPLIELLFNLTMAAAGIWLAITVFVIWRRRASNLTPVNAAERNRKAEPDFLKVDHDAREAAQKRGEAFEKELTHREREEEKAKARAARKPEGMAQKIAGFVAMIMSLFTLATMIHGSIFSISRMGQLMEEYSTSERILAVIGNHPIAFTITVLVIAARLYTYFAKRSAKEG